MPAKLLGLFLLLGSFLCFLRMTRAHATGCVGPRHRLIRRETAPWRFKLAVAGQFAGALICLVAGALCLVHFSLGH